MLAGICIKKFLRVGARLTYIAGAAASRSRVNFSCPPSILWLRFFPSVVFRFVPLASSSFSFGSLFLWVHSFYKCPLKSWLVFRSLCGLCDLVGFGRPQRGFHRNGLVTRLVLLSSCSVVLLSLLGHPFGQSFGRSVRLLCPVFCGLSVSTRSVLRSVVVLPCAACLLSLSLWGC